MSLLLYVAVALLLLWIAHRALMPLPRAAALVLILLPMCVTGKALLTGGVFGPVDLPYFTEPLRDIRVPLGVAKPHNGMLSDLYAQMIPWRKAVQFAISHGRWPLWNPFILSGTQLAAAAQPAAYSPFTLLACLLPVAHSITFSAAMTFFLAGLGAFLFAREIGCRESVALSAAAAAGIIALLLSAIYLMPMFEAAPQTMEQQFRMGGYRDVPRGATLAESGARILTDFFPHLHGRWWMRKIPHWVPLETSAAGSIVVALAVYAFVRVRRRETIFFGALALFGILCGAGWSPLAALMQKLPLFDIALNERFTFAAAFSLVILAAIGIEHALATRDKSLGYALVIATIIFAAGAFTIDRLHVMEDKLPEWGVYTLFGELACLGIAAIAVLALKNRGRAIAITILLLIT